MFNIDGHFGQGKSCSKTKDCLTPVSLEFTEFSEKRLRPDREAFHDQAALALPLRGRERLALLLMTSRNLSPSSVFRRCFSGVCLECAMVLSAEDGIICDGGWGKS